MTEEYQSPSGQAPAPEAGEERHDEDTVQTLTDLFDRLDRAAFKRVLEHRDADASAAPASRTGKR
jgi:hypothetical protein